MKTVQIAAIPSSKQSSDRQKDTNKEIKTSLISNHCFAITAAATKDARAAHHVSPPVWKRLSLKLTSTSKENFLSPDK